MNRRYLYVLGLSCLMFSGIWFFYFKGDRLPFSDISWKNGLPIVKIGSESMELVSVNGIAIETLREHAIKHWGPAYQYHFAFHFSGLLEEAGAELGLCTYFVVKKEKGTKSIWQFNTTRRRKACLQMINERQRIASWKQIPVSGKGLAMLESAKEKTAGEWLDVERALEDLYTLRWLLLNCYSYPERLPQAEEKFCVLKKLLKKRISRQDFAFQVQDLLAALGDIHSHVSIGRSGVTLPAKTLPFDLQKAHNEFLCLKPWQKDFLDADYPLLISINEIPIQSLFQTASRLGGDPLSWMMRIDLILKLHGLESSGKLRLKLHSSDGREKEIVLNEILRKPDTNADFRVSGKKHDGLTGYLRLSRGLFSDFLYEKEIINEMYGLRNTKGLILDLRGNPGGSRHAIPLLTHYFIPPEAHPLILNIGTYKMATHARPPKSAEVLRGRDLYSDEWTGWTKSQRQVISAWKSKGIGAKLMGGDSISAPHFMVTDTTMPEGAYYYAQPVVVLIDHRTASAAELILVNLKGRPNIKIMGENSIGGSGYPQHFELPNSHIQLLLSSMRSYHPNGTLIGNTWPDILYTPTVKEIVEIQMQKRDGMLERAKEYIHSL